MVLFSVFGGAAARGHRHLRPDVLFTQLLAGFLLGVTAHEPLTFAAVPAVSRVIARDIEFHIPSFAMHCESDLDRPRSATLVGELTLLSA